MTGAPGQLPAWPYPRIAAHRGGGTLAPENTLAALRTGARFGQRMVEFDAKLSQDDVAFLLHDDDVERTSNGHGLAAALSYASLAGLDAGSWFDTRFAGETMPTLTAAAGVCAEMGLLANVEIKPCPGREVRTGRRVALEVLRAWSGAAVPPLLSSFAPAALAAAREVAPALPRGLLFGALSPDWFEQVQTLGCISVHLNHRTLTAADVAAMHAAGLRVLVYTVNDPRRARMLLDWGVDTVCTDRIDLIAPV